MNSNIENIIDEEKLFATEMVRPIRVLLWCPYGITLLGGGAGLNSQRLYQAAKDGQVSVTVVHGMNEHPDIEGFCELVKMGRLSKPSKVLEHVVFLCRSWLWLRKNVNDYDVFHGIDAYEATISPAVWAKKRGVPVIIKPANHTSIGPTYSWRRIFNRPRARAKAMAGMEGVVAISQMIHNDLLAIGIPQNRVFDIPNGIDCRRYRPVDHSKRIALRESLGIPQDEFCILSVAGLRPTKRIEWSLEALKLVVERGLNARLYLVGNQRTGEYLRYLKARILALGISEQVVFVGEVDDTVPYYQAADAFCLTSKNEGMPNSLLEAMACGQCCLVTPVSGSSDIVDDGIDGYFITNPAELAVRLTELMRDPARRQQLGEAARLKAQEYSLEIVWKKYFELLKRVSSTAIGEAR